LLGADAGGELADPLLLTTAVGSYSSCGAGGGVGVVVGSGGGGSLVGCAATGVADAVGVAVGAGTVGVAIGTVGACESRARRGCCLGLRSGCSRDAIVRMPAIGSTPCSTQ
jgi:hypothetical protein